MKVELVVFALCCVHISLLGLSPSAAMGQNGLFSRDREWRLTVSDSIKGAVGAEDITIHQPTGMAFISSDDRRAARLGIDRQGAIYVLDLAHPETPLRNVSHGFASDFHPHGISLFQKADGGLRLFVVNHPKTGAAIEVFDWDGRELRHLRTVTHPLIFSPNDVCAVSENAFYVTNDRGSHTGAGHFLEMSLRLKRSYVVYFDGQSATKAARKLSYANGINCSADGRHLYVASVLKGKLKVFGREEGSGGGLSWVASVKCGAALDNIERDSAGNLWVASHHSLTQFVRHVFDSTRNSPWSVLVFDVSDPRQPTYTKVFAHNGRGLSGASVAAVWRNRVLVGTVFGPNIGIGTISEPEKITGNLP